MGRDPRRASRAPVGTDPLHLCRIRYFGDENAWSLAFYTYSHDRYEPSVFDNGTFHGTPEEAFDVGAVYLARSVTPSCRPPRPGDAS